jgi:hypothetical protein
MMLAYHGIEDNENAPENVEMENGDNVEVEVDLEYFHFNDFVQLEVAHLQLGRVETFFFPNGQSSMDNTSLPMEKFSSEGMKLWAKYFAPPHSSIWR